MYKYVFVYVRMWVHSHTFTYRHVYPCIYHLHCITHLIWVYNWNYYQCSSTVQYTHVIHDEHFAVTPKNHPGGDHPSGWGAAQAKELWVRVETVCLARLHPASVQLAPLAFRLAPELVPPLTPPVHVRHGEVLRHTCTWVMSHTYMSHITQVTTTCHTTRRVLLSMWLRHITHLYDTRMERARVDESCYIFQWFNSRVWSILRAWPCHVTHANESVIRVYESCNKCHRVTSHVCTGHVTYKNESCHKCV